MKQYAVIVAGGSGTRMGGGIPKQFRSLSGKPMLWWTMKAFHNENRDTNIILVLPEEFIQLWNDFFNTLPEEDRIPHQTTAGGDSRTESVKKGLTLIKEEDSLVAIHDGARPLVKPDLIKKGWKIAREKRAALPVIPVSDSLREINEKGESKASDRERFRAVQTPQVFHTALLKRAYEETQGSVFTDDASVVEAIGMKVTLFDGDPSNLKITTPADMAVAKILMGENA